ncbi:flavodoxin family protein [Methanobrevibacter sp. YE315]|uniref:flavodoxin family protein n=1 Tax=Methanobrevibacter sp. YE315 TaxID=1609968 RepID=UPI000829546B|nr:NAD(P)H-dependent oxidoreductase [Methanobrevibacter sp. YE315]
MKCVIINGSPRKKNTWSVVEQVKSNLEAEFDEIHLMKEKIPMCNGCFKCILEGENRCPHFDKINPIIESIRKSDAIIIASPVYSMNVSALLKNFFDHTAYLYHRPEFFDKKALVAVTTAGAGQKKVASYIDETLRHWGVNKVYKISIACGGKDHLETKKIDQIAGKFRKDMESDKLSSPKFVDVFYYNLWRAMALSDDPLKADKEYWFETGLVNHDFAPQVKLNVFKKAFSKILFFILRKAIK